MTASLATAVTLFSCTDPGGLFDDADRSKTLKYYSAQEPGRWQEQAADHDIQVSIIEDAKGQKGIEVFVPFTSAMDERHYVEAIALLDEKEKQLAIVRFRRGEKARTIFPITDKTRFPVFVVSKCNMHDMWRKKVTGKEMKEEGE